MRERWTMRRHDAQSGAARKKTMISARIWRGVDASEERAKSSLRLRWNQRPTPLAFPLPRRCRMARWTYPALSILLCSSAPLAQSQKLNLPLPLNTAPIRGYVSAFELAPDDSRVVYLAREASD